MRERLLQLLNVVKYIIEAELPNQNLSNFSFEGILLRDNDGKQYEARFKEVNPASKAYDDKVLVVVYFCYVVESTMLLIILKFI